jgi:hypothetical protein
MNSANPLPVASGAVSSEEIGAPVAWPPVAWPIAEDVAVEFQKTNPKRMLSEASARYIKYQGAKTVGEAKALGATVADLKVACERGELRLTNAQQAESARNGVQKKVEELEAVKKVFGHACTPDRAQTPTGRSGADGSHHKSERGAVLGRRSLEATGRACAGGCTD